MRFSWNKFLNQTCFYFLIKKYRDAVVLKNLQNLIQLSFQRKLTTEEYNRHKLIFALVSVKFVNADNVTNPKISRLESRHGYRDLKLVVTHLTRSRSKSVGTSRNRSSHSHCRTLQAGSNFQLWAKNRYWNRSCFFSPHPPLRLEVLFHLEIFVKTKKQWLGEVQLFSFSAQFRAWLR